MKDTDLLKWVIFGAIGAIWLIISAAKWLLQQEQAKSKKLEQESITLKSHYENLLKEERDRYTKYVEQRDKTGIENALRQLELNGRAITELIKIETKESFDILQKLTEQLKDILSKHDRRGTGGRS